MSSYLSERHSRSMNTLCDEDHGVVRRPCVIDGCKGDVISLDGYRQAEVCNTCGQPQLKDE
ncbi:hypothetical protein LRP30_33100 [Bradyrhizobium sp. C-145]|uniref:hypothetical protein n=1 Tax=Bradyrhizobium sp. C-145 TaxID=574727 RepID=UPI00201B50C0|nr:hypothetical protein [Bradyrhizobium sp. C-145]UQR61624.1 hypothetical protein LRP30_33100 [Bradyrhizobium sp. C-145]